MFTFFYSDADESVTKVSNYDYVVSFDTNNPSVSNVVESEVCIFTIDAVDYTLSVNTSKNNDLKLSTKNEAVKLDFDKCLSELISTYHNRDNNDVPVSKMELIGSASKIEFKISFNIIGVKENSSGKKVENLKGMIFVKVNG
jgi:hypothetical protein